MVKRVKAPPAGKQPDQGVAQALAQGLGNNIARAVAGTLGLSGERMSRVDTAWLRMDSRVNLMQIVGVWHLVPGVTHAAVCQRIEATLLRHARFRQRVEQDMAGATWVLDRHFELARHVVRARLPASPAGQHEAALKNLVAELASEPLDRRHPLWQMHLVEHYSGPDGRQGSALVIRIHHCIADGMALLSVIMAMVDGAAAAPPPETHQAAPQDAQAWLIDTLVKPLTQLTVKALDAAGEGAAYSMGLLGEPGKSVEHALAQGAKGSLALAKAARQALADSAALALMPDDAPTRLKGQASGRKKVAWCPPLALDEVKAAGQALGCSVNDVLLGCVAGALGHYLQAQGDAVGGLDIRAMVPVNLRPPGAAPTLGNHFGLAPLLLPIGIGNPVERIYEVRRRMRALKHSYQPLLTFGLLAVAGLSFKAAQDAMLDVFSKKTTAVITNVPGPLDKLSFCGATLEQTMFWVPQSGNVGLGVSILSYGGGVQFGVMTDAALCAEPQRILDEFVPEFNRLLLALMLAWNE
ncbi:MAG: wax ester/triacylglycerol synthase family O-acyltransferase [Polaromonas sp.]